MSEKNKRLPKVLLIYNELIPSVRLCGHIQMEYLAAQKRIEYRICRTIDIPFEDLDWPDIVVLGRLDSWQEYEYAAALKRAKKYIIYILDDDLLNIPMTLSSAPHYHSESTQRSLSALIELSDAILSPSPILLEKYAKNKRGILTEEPAIKPIDYQPHTGDPITIGFAGSIDRTGDIENILSDVYQSIAREYGSRVEFAFFGAIPSFASQLNAKVIPYINSYDAYREQLNNAKWDIGLAPMPDTPFHSCKHYNKFIEYAAGGVMGVFSDCGPYRRLKEEIGIGVFCCNDSEAWYQAIKDLIDHLSKREEIRKRASECARTELSVERIAERLYAENEEIFAYRAPNIPCSVNRMKFGVGSRLYRKAKHLIKKVLKHIPGFRKLAGYFAETRRLAADMSLLKGQIDEQSCRCEQLEAKVAYLSKWNSQLLESNAMMKNRLINDFLGAVMQQSLGTLGMGHHATSRLAVYTVLMGEYEPLTELEYTDPECDYYCITNNRNLKSETWKIIYMDNQLGESNCRFQRRLKLSPHILFPQYEHSLYIDASIRIRKSVFEWIEKYSTGKPLLTNAHPERNCIYQESIACLILNKDSKLMIDEQMERYRGEGYPEEAGLIWSAILYRKHHDPQMIRVDELWLKEILKGSRRDQLSFNYVCWKTGFEYDAVTEDYREFFLWADQHDGKHR